LKLRAGRDTRYNPTVVDAAEKVIIPYPVASMVEIVKCADANYNGKHAVVTSVDDENSAVMQLQLLSTPNQTSTPKTIPVNLDKDDIVRRAF